MRLTCLEIPIIVFLLSAQALAQGPDPMPPSSGASEQDVAGPGVARISLIHGDVSVRRGDSGDYVAAALNAPIMAQDYLLTGPSGQAEVQFDFANIIRLGAGADVRFTEIDRRRNQVQIARGTVTYIVRSESRGETAMQSEISTPSVSVHPVKRGSYRISVLEDGQTQVTVRSGEAEINTPKGIERVHAGSTMLVRGTAADPEFQLIGAIPRDDWDTWNQQRDHELDRSQSSRYLSRDIYGGEELDANGRWIYDAPYGNVWVPTVSAGWAPYRVGRWAWEDYYGWTWVSGDPWGWAPYHYGSWYSGSQGWCWYPGPIYGHHFWRPALVAFFGFGGGGFGLNSGFGFGHVGWVPLAPFERFQPWYGRGSYGGYGRGVVNNINIVNNTNITNIYRNARNGNAATGVNAQDFAGGRFHNNVGVAPDQLRQAGLVRGALPVAPTAASLRFADRQIGAIPRNAGADGRFYSRNQPAQTERIPFEQQRRTLEQSFGGQGRRFGQQSGIAVSGSAVTGGAALIPQTPAAATGRGAGPNNAGSANGSWNRFGNPARVDGSAVGTVPQSGGASRVRDDSSWRRFNDAGRGSGRAQQAPIPATAPTPGNAVVPRAATVPQATGLRGDSNGAWSRFGTPRNDVGAGSGSTIPRTDSGARQPAREGWSRYESRTQATAPQVSQPYRAESLRISPPIVRERAMPQAARQSYSAPAGAETHSTPSYSHNSGGGGSVSHASGNSGSGARSSGNEGSRGGGGNSGGGHGGGGRGR